MNKLELGRYGIVITVEKRSWYVRHYARAVAAGLIGSCPDARKKAKKEAHAAACAYFVRARITNTLDVPVREQARQALSNWFSNRLDELMMKHIS